MRTIGRSYISAARILFVTFFATILTTTIVAIASAASNIFILSSVDITDKTTRTDAAIVEFNDSTITNNIGFYDLNEYVTYSIGLKNSSSDTYKITKVAVGNENEHLAYEYDDTYNEEIKPNETFDFALKAIYKTLVTDQEDRKQSATTTIKFTFEIISNKSENGEISETSEPKESKTEEIALVPDTGGLSGKNYSAMSSTLMVVLGIALISSAFFFVKKHRKASAALLSISLLAGVVFVPVSAMADSDTSDEFSIINNLTFFGECTGICYDGNGDDGVGTMADQAAADGDTVVLHAPNYSRAGYGFAGWNTKGDGTGTDYGPNEKFTMSGDGVWLHANWVKASGTMQEFSCDSIDTGAVVGLTDTRDNEVYAVAKLADGNCWTIENMRHKTSDSVNINVEERMTNSEDDGNIYGYGVYYGEEDAYIPETAAGNICPSNWRKPSGSVVGDFSNLVVAQNGENWNSDTAGAISKLLKYPTNFVYGGLHVSGTTLYRGGAGEYLGSDAPYDHGNNANNRYAQYLTLFADASVAGADILQVGSRSDLMHGQAASARCVISGSHDITLNYDANGGTNAPAAQTIRTTADSYEFTITSSEPTRERNSFYKWSTEADLDPDDPDFDPDDHDLYDAGDTISVSGETTLYALWNRDCPGVCYNAGSAGVVGTMSRQYERPNSNLVLTAPNYSRAGYGFAGWNTEPDGSGAFYGPNETITLPADGQLQLYATWIAAEDKTMQEFNPDDYDHLPINSVIALRDERDNNVYAVAKLPDGNWWMTENLRLDLNSPDITVNSSNTHSPTTAFLNSLNANFLGNAIYTMADCENSNHDCEDQISFGTSNIDRSKTADPKGEGQTYSWYGYGAVYNWYTATAGNGDHSTSGDVTDGDICPSSWHLPTGEDNGEFAILNVALGLDTFDTRNSEYVKRWMSYPINLVNNGSNSGRTHASGRGYWVRLWSSTARTDMPGQGLALVAYSGLYRGQPDNTLYGGHTSTTNKWYAYGVRCLAD